MPELPEVETVCRGLAKVLTSAKLTKLDQRRKDLRAPMPKGLAGKAEGTHITAIHRRAKYILIDLDNGQTLILHLGMSGRMVINQKPAAPAKHDHLIFHFDNGAVVTFNDPRRFGLCDLATTKDIEKHRLFRSLGFEPLEPEFTAAALAEKLKGKKTAIKIALMDQRVVVGVGNIYVAEALFMAGIRPTRLAGKVTRDEMARLVPSIRKVLRAAIKAGGSSLRDYVQADGELGYFQNQHAVYGREGEPCKGCTCDTTKTGGVKRITQGGRSTFYCPTKQK